MTRLSLAEQLQAHQSRPAHIPKAANDNKPKPARHNSTLPALRWLWDNHPHLAPTFAAAIPKPADNWFVEVEPTRQEIRPTVGELIKASHDDEGAQLPISFLQDGKFERAAIGPLKFLDGKLMEWGVTAKGKKLKPTDRPRISGEAVSTTRSPGFYLNTKATTKSPMEAQHYHRPIHAGPALSSMYDPLPGVEDARRLLRSIGVDGSVDAGSVPGITRYPTGVAEGAHFFGGVSNPSGNSSSGALMWEGPEDRENNATAIVEEVAARGSLKSIGIRLGYSESYAHVAGKEALVGMAEKLFAMSEKKKAA
jgi:hypothetical protein